MTNHGPILIQNLTKVYGQLHAVDDLSFTVSPGRVTGFLGPNGSGKTTTLRILLGLAKATSGTATFGEKSYTSFKQPLATVGAALEASSFHPGRTGLDHLLSYSPLTGAPDSRASELLDLVGLTEAAKQRVGGYSLGMRQRLALATALLGDPDYLVLDEPANGLDPMGIRWLRDFLRHLASSGKTILVSSHILSEVQQSVDDVVIIAKGRLRFADSISGLSKMASQRTFVRTPNNETFTELAISEGWSYQATNNGFSIEDLTSEHVGHRLFARGIEVHELSDQSESLEDFFFRLTTPSPTDSSAPHSSGAGDTHKGAAL